MLGDGKSCGYPQSPQEGRWCGAAGWFCCWRVFGRCLTWAANSRTWGSKLCGYLGTELFRKREQSVNALGRERWVWGTSSRTAGLEQEGQGKTGGGQERREALRRGPEGLEAMVWTWVSREYSQVSLITCILKLKRHAQRSVILIPDYYGVDQGFKSRISDSKLSLVLFSLYLGPSAPAVLRKDFRQITVFATSWFIIASS